ncbi:hypothetical protein VDT1_4284 [Vibrio sp. 16]|nr:hypothetical protein VDT1_4284 [Vibrio sp. 16]
MEFFVLIIMALCVFYIVSTLSGKKKPRHHKYRPKPQAPSKPSSTFYERSDYAQQRPSSIENVVPIPTSKDKEPEVPEHKASSHLATPNEQRFYLALKEATPSCYEIHCQVSLMALVQPVDWKNNSRTWAKRMDFVITDHQTKIVVVIELDDRTHNWKKRIKRDKYVNEVLSKHHRLVRFKSQRVYNPAEIREELGFAEELVEHPV